MYLVQVDSFSDWREKARALLLRGVEPEVISWDSTSQISLLGEPFEAVLEIPLKYDSLNIPKAFISLAKNVACFRDDGRWALLYSVAWRLVFEDKHLLTMSIDDEVSRLLSMQKIIARDKHKMEAFVRFKRVKKPANLMASLEVAKAVDAESLQAEDVIGEELLGEQIKMESVESTPKKEGQDEEYYVAWFEPEHLIVPIKTSFFIKRFRNMNWSILTPDICAHWDKEELIYTAGIAKPPKVEDDLELLWMDYYKSIFNPARLKVKAMQSEMPKKYWPNLPEAALIKPLIAGAHKRVNGMLENQDKMSWKKTETSTYIKNMQSRLRLAAKNQTD